jgi:hypothetical protein
MILVLKTLPGGEERGERQMPDHVKRPKLFITLV